MADQHWHSETIALYEHFPQMVRIAQRYVHDRSAAEEVVQDAYIRFNEAFGRSLVRSPKAYLRTAVRNTAVSWIRRQDRAEQWRPLTTPSELPIDDVCALRSEFAAVRRECAALPDRQKRVLELRYWHGLGEQEIASRMGISPGAVKTHAHRAKHKLKEALLADVAC